MNLVPIEKQSELVHTLLGLLSNDLVSALFDLGFEEEGALGPIKGNWLHYRYEGTGENKNRWVNFAITPYKIHIFYMWQGKPASQILSYCNDSTFLNQWRKLGAYTEENPARHYIDED